MLLSKCEFSRRRAVTSKRSLSRVLAFLLLLPLYSSSSTAQSPPFAVSAGYAPPTITLAPGALITIYVAGLHLGSQTFAASAVPLPTVLDGISVSVSTLATSTALIAPMVSAVSVPDSPFVAITLEVPSEIFPGFASGAATGTVTVSQGNVAGTPIFVLFAESNVHMIQSCVSPIILSSHTTPQACYPVAQHADGSSITSSAPARPGEQIVLYALGLGKTFPPVADGSASTGLAASVYPIVLDLNFEPDVPARVVPTTFTNYTPNYAGLVPGLVGLYQVNITLPAAFPAGVPPCGAGVGSNLTITVFAPDSSDGGGICVSPTP